MQAPEPVIPTVRYMELWSSPGDAAVPDGWVEFKVLSDGRGVRHKNSQVIDCGILIWRVWGITDFTWSSLIDDWQQIRETGNCYSIVCITSIWHSVGDFYQTRRIGCSKYSWNVWMGVLPVLTSGLSISGLPLVNTSVHCMCLTWYWLVRDKIPI